jgi:hypothetical protein
MLRAARGQREFLAALDCAVALVRRRAAVRSTLAAAAGQLIRSQPEARSAQTCPLSRSALSWAIRHHRRRGEERLRALVEAEITTRGASDGRPSHDDRRIPGTKP